uniref:Uncharacterized protein isoform X2 n=1 Tax=Nicotiana tabacum TaxID=4097 RepID=A0A1S4A0U6_TOBAC|nr:PREDICTED: uncharacterized protein LOC107792513 isoform X2 [Nicotiana tabacum]
MVRTTLKPNHTIINLLNCIVLLALKFKRIKNQRRTQANKNNRAKQNVPHIGGSKSIATLMDEQAKNGIEPTRAEIFILTYKKRKNGRLLDEESAKAVVVDTNHDHERIPESPNMHNVAGNTPSSCG